MLTSSWGCLFPSQMVQSSSLPQVNHASSLQEEVLCPCVFLVATLQHMSLISGQFSQEQTELCFVVEMYFHSGVSGSELKQNNLVSSTEMIVAVSGV